ncbi:ATP-grasp domain-containing protein, partial [Streptomyces sp. t39]|uniref:ATP-grasp domain-containing protein n=1 Tax=Streptomyces sp. t39 TaxID=1828156 RepID=UPI0011CDC3AB
MTQPVAPQLVMVGFFPAFIRSLERLLPPRSLTVVEDPGVYVKKPIAAMEGSFSCLTEVRLAAYQQSGDAVDEIVRLDRQTGVTGVLPGLEYAVEAAAEAAAALGLPGLGTGAARTLRDKILLRETTTAAGMAAPAFRELTSAAGLAAFLAREPRRETVLKPANRQASLGVRFLPPDAPADEVTAAWRATTGADEGAQIADRRMTWRYLAEERLTGPEVSVEALVADGRLLFLNITAKTTADGPHPVELGHVLPAALPAATDAALRTGMESLVDAVGIGSGILCAEWILTADGPVLVECAGRCPGDSLMELIALAWGGDFHHHLAGILRGDVPDLPATATRCAAIRFLHAPPGTVTAVEGADEARELPGVQEITVTATPGHTVSGLHSSWDRLGQQGGCHVRLLVGEQQDLQPEAVGGVQCGVVFELVGAQVAHDDGVGHG